VQHLGQGGFHPRALAGRQYNGCVRHAFPVSPRVKKGK
jgi:hypothetical protein